MASLHSSDGLNLPTQITLATQTRLLQGVGPLHAFDPKDQFNQEGFQAYRQFTAVFILDKVQRQDAAGADDVDQKGFLELPPRDRDGMFTDEDWQVLVKRSPALQTTETKARFADATRLFFAKNEVDGYNGKKVRGLGNPIPMSAANHNCATARPAS